MANFLSRGVRSVGGLMGFGNSGLPSNQIRQVPFPTVSPERQQAYNTTQGILAGDRGDMALQRAFAPQLLARTQGRAPSVAVNAGQNLAAMQNRSAQAVAASARGPAKLALVGNAMLGAQNAGTNIGTNMAQVRAQEISDAERNYAAYLASLRQGNLGFGQLGVQQQQVGQEDQLAQYQGELQRALGQANINVGERGQRRQAFGNVLAVAGQAAGSAYGKKGA